MKLTVRNQVIAVSVLLAGVCGGASADVFTDRFASRVQQVKSTAIHEDDLALAQEMLQAAAMLVEPAEIVPLARAAAELTERQREAQDVAAKALTLLAEHSPDDRQAALDRLVDLRQVRFAAARTQEERPIAGEALIDALLLSGDAAAARGDHSTAVTAARRAVMVASAIKSGSADKARRQLDQATAAAARGQRLAMLMDRVKANPSDLDAARQLLKVYVLEMDDPAGAVALLAAADDPSWKQNVPLAAKDVKELSGEQMRQLGDWYRGLLTSAPPGSRIVPLGRAFTYYGYFLRDHAQDAAERQKIEQAQKHVESQIFAIDQVPPVIERKVIDTGPKPAIGEMPVAVAGGDSKENALFQALRAPKEARQKETGWIDLLEAIVPQRAAKAGNWGSEGGAVQGTSTGDLAYAQLPVRVQGSYRIFIALTPREGKGDVTLVLPVGGKRVELRLPMANPHAGGFQIGQGRAPGLTLKGGEILPGDACTLQVEVKVDGDQAELLAFLDDAPWSRWKGPVADLSVPEGRYQLDPSAAALALDAADVPGAKLLVDVIECKLKPTNGQVQVFGL